MRRFEIGSMFVAVIVLLIASNSNAQSGAFNSAFGFSTGYSHVQLENDNALFHGKDGAYFDMDFAFRIPRQKIPILVGVGVTGSGYWDSQDTSFRLSPNTFATATLYSDLGFFELEPRVAIALYTKRNRGWFVRPRIGAGLLLDSYGIDHVTQSVFQTTFSTEYHTGAAFEVRPAVQAGFSWGPGEVGAEVSYMAAWGDFGAFGNEAQEFRAGAFYNVRF